MDLRLTGKLALVSGSTAGIGYAIAEALVREGARVVVNGRTRQSVEPAVASLNAIAPKSAFRVLGRSEHAGRGRRSRAPFSRRRDPGQQPRIFEPRAFEEITDDDWSRFFEVNVLSGIRLARLYLPSMRRNNWGRIIFISSESGVQIPPEMIHYGMTKTAQLAVSRGLAEALAGTGITVNCVLPDQRARAASRISSRPSPNAKARHSRSSRPSSSRRSADVADQALRKPRVASLVVYVASPLSSATTGAALRVDGGVVKSGSVNSSSRSKPQDQIPTSLRLNLDLGTWSLELMPAQLPAYSDTPHRVTGSPS